MKLPAFIWVPVYRTAMKIAHRYNWHYAPPIYPDHDTMLWCQWCGMRYIAPRIRATINDRAVNRSKSLAGESGWMGR